MRRLINVERELRYFEEVMLSDEERELAKTIIKKVQDSMQELDQEVEEVIRLGRYSEGCRRPINVRMRSQVVVEEIMARKGKLADDTEHKDVWIKFAKMSGGSRKQGGSILTQLDSMREFQNELNTKTKQLDEVKQELHHLQVGPMP
ncbi:hypothetical protein E2C01_058987 [Portunus trituberculatus]|uniref:Uncharacterized protein n=1 Tax=Portunus trituberculatus TaxID=210409 RepID=A0A5B7H5L7_PORTR|nr:hypothetical protein [Portunus trituberculatus]